MCLSKLTATYNPPLADERDAWKIVQNNHTLHNSIQLGNGEWINDPSDIELHIGQFKYRTGFHCFLDESEATIAFDVITKDLGLKPCDKFALIKVRVADVTAIGLLKEMSAILAEGNKETKTKVRGIEHCVVARRIRKV